MKFLASKNNLEQANILLIGIPFDGTSSFRSGSRFAPDSVRIHSDGLETYSPYLDDDIENINFYDYGNICSTINNFHILSTDIENTALEFLKNNKKLIAIGGEHLITLPLVKLYKQCFDNLAIIHIDAHTDLRDSYLNEKYSHATVIRRISEIVLPENIFQFGIRSGLKEEFLFAKQNLNFQPFSLTIDDIIIKKLKNKNIYITIDLDILDPSIFPGTGTPEPGGVSFDELLDFLKNVSNMNIIGADVVELSPDYDKSGVSSIVAAKIIRELIIILNKNIKRSKN